MKTLLTIWLCFVGLMGFAQIPGSLKPIAANVESALSRGETFVPVLPFSNVVDIQRMDVPEEVRNSGWGLVPDLAVLENIEEQRPEYLSVTVPGRDNQMLTLLLYQVNVGTPDFQVVYSDGTVSHDVPGVHYRGIIQGDYNSLVSFSLYRDQIMAMIADDNGNWNLGQLENPTPEHLHICYNDVDLASLNPFSCGMEDDLSPQENLDPPGHNPGQRDAGDCLRIWWEVGNSIVTSKGSGPAAVAWMTGVAAQVYTLYANEMINMSTYTFYVFTSPEPYSGGSSSARLSSFQNLNGTLNGDLAHYVTLGFGYGGIAAGFSGVCNPNYDQNMCYSDLDATYNNVPTYSWTVMVCTHEMGHLIGSRHTHACVWNGNNTAIDGCAGFVEGGCALPGNPPGGGTIMSYCHFNVGINFNLGFGPQPGDVIRNRVAGATCLQPACAPVPCTVTASCPPSQSNLPCTSWPGSLAAWSANNPPPTTAAAFEAIGGSVEANCFKDQDVTITVVDSDNGGSICGPPLVVTRTYTLKDPNNNMTSCSQTFSFNVDNDPPVFVPGPGAMDVSIGVATADFCTNTPFTYSVDNSVFPPLLTVIGINGPIHTVQGPAATENCGTINNIVPGSISYWYNGCQYRYFINFMYSDGCGNTTGAYEVILDVYDKTIPTIQCPEDVSIDCAADPNDTGLTGSPTGSDDCAVNLAFTYTDASVPGACPVRETITRTWTANDGCGNTNACTQTIVLQDFTGPTPDQGPGGFDAQVDLIYADFHNGTNHTHDCPNDLYLYHSPAEYLTYNGTDLRFEHFHGDEFQTVPKATATDVCGTVSQSINYGATTVDASMLPCTLKINLVWDFNDGCGNITQYTQVITIVDKAPLAINPNAPNLNQTVSCTANLDPVDLGGDIPNPSQSVDVDVFMDFDNCTNSIPIQPQGPPTAGGPTGLYWQDAITAGPCPETYTITRSWWAIDECGNVSLPFFQTIQVQDIVPPTWNQAMPANITVQCNAVPPAATPITASDNCDVSVNVTLSETSTKSADVNSCAYMNYTLTRTWTAMDNCGNMLQHTQTITVIDTQIPTLNGVPANTTVQCNAVPPPAVVTASDNCDPVVPVTLTETSTKSTDINSCAYMNYTITRTWTASDNCGNATARTQIITVVDTQIPTLIGVPANATVECDAVPAPANVSATDNCDPVVPVTLTETSTKSADVNGCAYMNYTITRTWKASDNCGNMSAGTQVITVQDTKPPVLAGVPANTTVQCHQVPPAAVVTATDNCDPDVPVTFSEQVTPGPCVDSYTLTRTWTASDNCGNATTSTQVINVIDTVNPTALCKDHTLYLNGDGEAQLYTYQIDNGSFDNCTLDHLDLSQYLFTCDDLGQNTVILTATDACGNTGTCTATVTVIDALPPHMVCLSPIDLYLDEFGTPLVLTPQDVDGGTTDNCTIVSLELSQTIFDCSDLGENSIKLFATDQSGNQGECSSNVRVYDLLPPVFTVVPEDVTAYCDEYGVPDEAEATDNCGIVSIVLTETQEYFAGGPEGSYLVQRTWVATDLAGNTSSAEQWITVLPDGQMVTLCNDDIVTAPSKAPVQATWDAPKVDDICNGSYAMTQMEGPASGSYFNPGTRTRITYGYQDSWGTRYECAFHVEVPGINDDYQVHIQQADADCNDLMIEACTITDVSGASLYWTPKGSGVEVEYSLQPGATLEKYANGTALLIGQWRDASGTNGWDGTLWFHHRRSYDGWTQAGGQANQPSADVDNWQFFEVNASASLFAGVGNLDTMRIQASPNHVGKGLQLGNGANGSPGQGGWCAIAGRNMNNVFVGRGELAFNQNCSNTNLIVDAAEVVSLNGADFPTTWSNGVTGPELGNAAPGNWSVQVTDENGQVYSHSFALVAPTGCTLLWEDACRELNSTWEATAWQISTYQNGTADRAVDGNTDGDFGNGSVTSTLAGWQNWWSADLQGNYNIESVRIWPRTDGNHSGLDPFYVLVSADPIPDLAPEQLLTTAGIRAIRHEGPMNEAWRMPVGLTGRYIKVQLAEEGRLMLAEVEALVCQDDRLDPIPGAPIWPNGPGNANGDKVATVSDLAAWPNPASDELNIYIHQSRVAATSVTILSMTGQQVYRQDLPDAREHQLRIPVGQWLSGMYTVVLSGTEGIQTQWVQVQH